MRVNQREVSHDNFRIKDVTGKRKRCDMVKIQKRNISLLSEPSTETPGITIPDG